MEESKVSPPDPEGHPEQASRRALVLSGGGSHGAYQVGVLKRLIGERGRGYGTVSGVSVGSINAVQIAQHAPGEQGVAVGRLEEFWRGIRGNASIYRDWCFFGKLAGLWKGGLVDSTPLEEILIERVDASRLAKSGVGLRVGAVNLRTGDYRCVEGTDPRIIDWIMASSAEPGFFPPRWIDGDPWTDGGVRDVTPISDVLACDPESIDVVLTAPVTGEPGTADPKSMKNVALLGLRCANLLSDEVWLNDLALVPPQWRPKVTIYAPKLPLPYESMDFGPEKLAAAIDQGFRDSADGGTTADRLVPAG